MTSYFLPSVKLSLLIFLIKLYLKFFPLFNSNQRLLNQSIKEEEEDTQNSKNQKMSKQRLLNQSIKKEDTQKSPISQNT